MIPQAPVSKPQAADWRHAFEVVPLAVAGVLAVAAAAHALHAPWWIGPAIAAAAGLTAVVVAALVTASGVAMSFAAAAGTAAAGWLAWAGVYGPWSLPVILGLVFPAGVLGMLYPVVRGHHMHAVTLARRRDELARLAAEGRRWPELLAALGARGVRLTETTETRAGHAYRLALPPTGKVTIGQLAELSARLETAARLQPGAIRFEMADHSGDVLMHVREKDILAEVVPYPADLGYLTVNEPFPVGLREDGTVCEVLYREVAVLIIGLRGSGKSNLLNVLIAQLGRCVDTVIFAIDLKGGRAALPWIRPWLEGRTPRPVIDWVATTRDEAERMLDAFQRAIDARAASGAGGDKITPSDRQPALVLVFDEIALVMGENGGPRTRAEGTTNRQMAGKATQLVQVGRSEAADLIMATQRGTVSMTGGGDLKSQCGLRIGLGVATEADARLIVPDNVQVQKLLARLTHPGTGIVADGSSAAPVKFYRLEPGSISRIAEELGRLRPDPDALTEAALGEDYAMRWTDERAGHLPGWQAAAARAEQDEIAERLEAVEAEFGDVNPSRQRMRELLAKAGVRGMTPAAIVAALESDGLGVARQTVQRWLGEDKAAGLCEQASHGRWKAVAG